MGERVGACLRGCVRRPASEGIPNVGIGVGGQGRQRHKVLRRQFPQKRPTNEQKRPINVLFHFQHGVLLAEIARMRKRAD